MAVYSKIRIARLPSHDSAVRLYQILVNPPAMMIAGVVVDIFSTDPCKAFALQRNDPPAIGRECHNVALPTVQRCHGHSLLPRQNGIRSLKPARREHSPREPLKTTLLAQRAQTRRGWRKETTATRTRGVGLPAQATKQDFRAGFGPSPGSCSMVATIEKTRIKSRKRTDLVHAGLRSADF